MTTKHQALTATRCLFFTRGVTVNRIILRRYVTRVAAVVLLGVAGATATAGQR